MAHAQNFATVLPLLKAGGIAVLTFVIFGGILGFAAGLYQTRKVERSPANIQFRNGTVPSPNGFQQGSKFSGLGKDWRGKVFDSANHTGINQFADGQRYTFSTYTAKGMRDHDKDVLRIDYNQLTNPWWLKRFVTDELVQTSPGQYLGKIQVHVLGMVFTLGFFELKQP